MRLEQVEVHAVSGGTIVVSQGKIIGVGKDTVYIPAVQAIIIGKEMIRLAKEALKGRPQNPVV